MKKNDSLINLNKTRLVLTIKTALAFSSLFISGCRIVGNYNIEKYNQSHEIFASQKVLNDIDYYGGDTDLLQKNFNIVNLQRNKLYNHLESKNAKNIVVGYSSNFTKQQIQDFDYVFDYLNNVFDIVNPDYHFVTGVLGKDVDSCDIKIRSKKLSNLIAAETLVLYSQPNNMSANKPVITFNNNVSTNDSLIRYLLLHEMMHILFGSSDMEQLEDDTYSLYNYQNLLDIASYTHSLETKESAPSWYEGPFVTEEVKNSFVTFMPKDLSTLIALYGDSSKEENRIKYIKLLNETYDKCNYLFGELKYYENNFNIPTM